ncbi:probable 2-oxoglutarate-dependent dioxygenase AOP1 [Hevea brasiliensis]|uniref:probable 2-oxoglutarate-dependent dioxygenase AOP1 n=1 Tax=Hevea brasiliensis TaxID=3981 RepID=UPI0025EE6CF4|nr:probable 2-oxoglutarate-dependent dioxygenase AOP1 [Hevea brasiliensis]
MAGGEGAKESRKRKREVSRKLRETFLNDLEELFALPLQTKGCYVSEKTFRGYVGQSPSLPLNECFTIDDPVISQNPENLCNILWQPQGKPSFSGRKIIHTFSKEVLELEKIMRMIIESLGVEKYLEENMDSTNYMLRATKYGSPQRSKELSHVFIRASLIFCHHEFIPNGSCYPCFFLSLHRPSHIFCQTHS